MPDEIEKSTQRKSLGSGCGMYFLLFVQANEESQQDVDLLLCFRGEEIIVGVGKLFVFRSFSA